MCHCVPFSVVWLIWVEDILIVIRDQLGQGGGGDRGFTAGMRRDTDGVPGFFSRNTSTNLFIHVNFRHFHKLKVLHDQ